MVQDIRTGTHATPGLAANGIGRSSAADNLNPALTDHIQTKPLGEPRRRLEYYDGVYATMLSDTTDQRDLSDPVRAYFRCADHADVDESTPFSIASRNG